MDSSAYSFRRALPGSIRHAAGRSRDHVLLCGFERQVEVRNVQAPMSKSKRRGGRFIAGGLLLDGWSKNALDTARNGYPPANYLPKAKLANGLNVSHDIVDCPN